MEDHWKYFARIAWLAAGALQTWVGLTLDSCKYHPAYRKSDTKFFTLYNLQTLCQLDINTDQSGATLN
jgi:hypothetical protein